MMNIKSRPHTPAHCRSCASAVKVRTKKGRR